MSCLNTVKLKFTLCFKSDAPMTEAEAFTAIKAMDMYTLRNAVLTTSEICSLTIENSKIYQSEGKEERREYD